MDPSGAKSPPLVETPSQFAGPRRDTFTKAVSTVGGLDRVRLHDLRHTSYRGLLGIATATWRERLA
jgi:hypothetical protein